MTKWMKPSAAPEDARAAAEDLMKAQDLIRRHCVKVGDKPAPIRVDMARRLMKQADKIRNVARDIGWEAEDLEA